MKFAVLLVVYTAIICTNVRDSVQQWDTTPHTYVTSRIVYGVNAVCDGAWTDWINLDGPGGAGDEEYLSEAAAQGLVCSSPTAIQAQTVNGIPAEQTGQFIFNHNPYIGFNCINNHQTQPPCLDYKVRYCC
ncbi:cartilage intermediate layer protein 1-like [Saccoglossus kowalevskii]|uniref:Mucin-2-like n=1 Tax=Saccoglossus kowalevskii TaxID=10224 RepID=A0ABM0LYB1_SACKO|nr:PREDICTED: mucin-2-like [Saccoglossus kowalevskii]